MDTAIAKRILYVEEFGRKVTVSGDELSYENLNDALLEQFPDIKREFAAKIGDFPDWELMSFSVAPSANF